MSPRLSPSQLLCHNARSPSPVFLLSVAAADTSRQELCMTSRRRVTGGIQGAARDDPGARHRPGLPLRRRVRRLGRADARDGRAGVDAARDAPPAARAGGALRGGLRAARRRRADRTLHPGLPRRRRTAPAGSTPRWRSAGRRAPPRSMRCSRFPLRSPLVCNVAPALIVAADDRGDRLRRRRARALRAAPLRRAHGGGADSARSISSASRS